MELSSGLINKDRLLDARRRVGNRSDDSKGLVAEPGPEGTPQGSGFLSFATETSYAFAAAVRRNSGPAGSSSPGEERLLGDLGGFARDRSLSPLTMRVMPFLIGTVDRHYEHLRVGMRDLFAALGIAAQDRQFFFHLFLQDSRALMRIGPSPEWRSHSLARRRGGSSSELLRSPRNFSLAGKMG